MDAHHDTALMGFSWLFVDLYIYIYCKRTNGTGYYGCCKRGDTTRKGQSALRSGASSLAFFNLKPSFHGRDDVLSLSMTWNVHRSNLCAIVGS